MIGHKRYTIAIPPRKTRKLGRGISPHPWIRSSYIRSTRLLYSDTASDGVALSVEAGMVTTVDVEYIGNRKSMKFHRLECESVRNMADKNKVPLSSRDDAIKMGFQPCGRCKP